MAKERKPVPIISVPVEPSLKKQLVEESDLDERTLSDTCRRLWREALTARSEARDEKQLSAAEGK